MTVDPGMNTGWAYWHGDSNPATGVFRFKKKNHSATTEQQLVYMWWEWSQLLNSLQPSIVYIEDCTTFASLVSSTASLRGDLSKLSKLIGGYACQCMLYNIKFELWHPRWKGTMKEDVVHRRVQRALGRKYRNHEVIAVAMGLKLVDEL